MCVIILKQDNKKLPIDVLESAGRVNPDGLGVVWLDTYEVTYHKSKEYKILNTNRPFAAHFRYATVGKVGLSNTHPFQCGKKKDEYLMMNGTIRNLGDKDTCDTKVLAGVIGELPRQEWSALLKQYTCRFVSVNVRNRSFQIFNKNLWTKKDGVWYSKPDVIEDNVIAVYGTLKKGYGNHNYYLGDSKMLGKGHTKSKYPLVVEGLPYLVDEQGKGHNVAVEVYKVNDKTLEQLDRLEGHPNWYCRRQIPIVVDGKEILCWVYFNTTTTATGKKWHKTYKKTYVQPPKKSTYSQSSFNNAFWSVAEPVDSPFRKEPKVTYYYEDDEFDYGGYPVRAEKPMCVNCFNDVEHDLFNNYHCNKCDAWFSETEILKP
jgi:gamma-glutamylaminecyclotransferase